MRASIGLQHIGPSVKGRNGVQFTSFSTWYRNPLLTGGLPPKLEGEIKLLASPLRRSLSRKGLRREATAKNVVQFRWLEAAIMAGLQQCSPDKREESSVEHKTRLQDMNGRIPSGHCPSTSGAIIYKYTIYTKVS